MRVCKPSGSHKSNTAFAQAYYCKKQGVERVATETGAGQWGSALSMAAALFDMKCRVFHGQSKLQPEARTTHLDGNLWSGDFPLTKQPDKFGRSLLEKIQQSRLTRHSDQ